MERFETITQNNQIFVLVPIGAFDKLREDAEMLEDIQALRAAKARNEEGFPAEFVYALCEAHDAGRPMLPLWRKYRSFTQKELAEKCTISQSYLADLEKGRRTPSFNSLKKLAAILNIDMEDVI